jgi:methyl-accepting chemotaxis protein
MKDRERQEKLIKAQREIEKKLKTQAKELIKVAENASNDNYLLHGKKDRIESILKENRASIDKYQPEFREDIARYESLVDMCSKEVNCINSEFYDRIKRKIESGNEVAAQVRSTNNELAAKLVEQSKNLKSSIEDLETRSESLKSQAKHYESLAKECKSQLKSLSTEMTHRMKLADDLENQANNLINGQPVPHRMIEVMKEFDNEALENSKKLEQVTSTLHTSTKRELGTLRQKLETFFTRELKEDVKTGSTPQRRVYDIPNRLSRATACTNITEDNEDLDHLNTSGFV